MDDDLLEEICKDDAEYKAYMAKQRKLYGEAEIVLVTDTPANGDGRKEFYEAWLKSQEDEWNLHAGSIDIW